MSSCLILLAGPSFLFSNDLALERYDDSTREAACRRMKPAPLQARIQDS